VPGLEIESSPNAKVRPENAGGQSEPPLVLFQGSPDALLDGGLLFLAVIIVI
jgi:hypothetical protein